MSIVSSSRFLAGGAALCAAAFASHAAQAQAARGHPTVTDGAPAPQTNEFIVAIVPRSGYYELWFKANDGSAPVKFGESSTVASTTPATASPRTCSTGSQARWRSARLQSFRLLEQRLIDTGRTVVDTVGL